MLKFGDRTQIGAVHLATSLVADLQLIAAAADLGATPTQIVGGRASTRRATASVVSLSGGALLANLVSVVLLVDRDRLLPPATGRQAPMSWMSRLRDAEAASAAAIGPRTPSAAIFLVLRRMRVPLIVLILIFAVSVLGLTLIPGEDPAGQPCGWASSTPSTS